MSILWLVLAMMTLGLPVLPATAGPSPADKEVRAVVLPVAIEGTVDASVQAGLDDTFVDQLQSSGYTVERAATNPGCTDPSCYIQFAAEHRATHLVEVRLIGQARDYEAKVNIINGATGTIVAHAKGLCDTCGAAEVRDLIADQAVRMQGTLRGLLSRPASIAVQSQPDGALVYLDGELIGKTPLEHATLSGKRRLEVVLDGYVKVRREVSLVDGVQERIELDLKPVPALAPSDRDLRRRKLGTALGATGIAAGVGLLAAGVAMLAINDRPIDRKCNGTNVDPDGDCKFLHNTLGAGIGLTVSGAVLAGAGIGLLVWGRKHGPKRGAMKAKLRLDPRGFAVTGRF